MNKPKSRTSKKAPGNARQPKATRATDVGTKNAPLAQKQLRRNYIDDALRFVAERGWKADDDDFFKALTIHLSETFGIKYVLIDEMVDPETARTLALCVDGRIVDNIHYGLKNSPCENVLKKKACHYPRNVCELFPKDKLLAELQAESYLGIPLFDASAENAIGLIAMLDTKPLEDVEDIMAVLKVVAIRAAAELERRALLETLQKNERALAEAQRIAHFGSWQLDIVNDQLNWSDEVYRIFEIDPNSFEASYETFLNAIHPDDRAKVDKAYADSMKSGQPYDISHRLLMADGRIKYVQEHCETRYDTEGNPLESIGTIHDITEIKMAEEKQRHFNTELEQQVAARTAELDEINRKLERFNQLMVEREMRVIEIKHELNRLCQETGRPPAYPDTEAAMDAQP